MRLWLGAPWTTSAVELTTASEWGQDGQAWQARLGGDSTLDGRRLEQCLRQALRGVAESGVWM